MAARRAPGADLAAARARAGLTLEEAAKRTRIPQRYLEALEKGDHAVFPAGPFLAGYTRQYRRFLDLPEDAGAALPEPEPELTVTRPERPSRATRSRGLRVAGVGALAAVCLALVVAIVDRTRGDAAPTLGVAPDQRVALRAEEAVRARVEADGEVVFQGALPPGKTSSFSAHDRLVVELDSLEVVDIRYNDRPLEPLGAASRPRRLVFVDDREP